MSSIAAVGRQSVEVLYTHAHKGIITAGEMTVMGVEAVKAGVTDMVKGRFSWTEFLLRFGSCCAFHWRRRSWWPSFWCDHLGADQGAVASQIGASSFSGAVNGIEHPASSRTSGDITHDLRSGGLCNHLRI
ncbi:MAG: hypothetical protein R2693_07645 [Nocardioidaceae bacterium]